MAHDPTPDNVLARFYELTEARNRRDREAEQAAWHRRLVATADIDPTKLSPQAQRILRWLTEWDEWAMDGLVEILITTRSTAIQNTWQDWADRKRRDVARPRPPQEPTAGAPNKAEGLGL